MAYITVYTLHQLTRNISNSKENITKEVFIEHVFNNPRLYDYFNTLEKSYLYNFSQTLKNPFEFLVQMPERHDTGTYVREGDEKLKYHLYHECELLNKDFIGFKIPQEVKEHHLIAQFREWFEVNKFIERYIGGEINKGTIIFSYNTSFAKKHQLPILNEDYDLIVERLNSGHVHFDESFNLQNFYKDISNWLYSADNRLNIRTWKLLGKWHSYYNKSNTEVIKLLDKLEIDHNFRSFNSIETIVSVLEEHHSSMWELIKLLRRYFCWTYKLESIDFDIITLKNFNMKCCSNCEEIRVGNVSIKNREER